MAADVLITNLTLWPAVCLAGALSLEPPSAWVRAATLTAETTLRLEESLSEPEPAGEPDRVSPGWERAEFIKVDWDPRASGEFDRRRDGEPGEGGGGGAGSGEGAGAGAGTNASLLRTGGTLTLSDGFAVEAGMSNLAVNRRWAGGQAVVRGDTQGVGREAALYDVTLKLTALQAGPLRLSMLGGVRASSIDASARSRSETAAFAAVPVTGLAVDLSLTPQTVLRTSAVGSAEGGKAGNSYTEFRIESVTTLSPAAAVSVGWQRMSTDLERGALQAAMRRDAVVLELRFRF